MTCPSCGAELEGINRFSHLVVCPSCAATVLVDAQAARVSGRMALLPKPDSPLFVGAAGRIAGTRFEVLGRVRYGYANGYWDEWYLLLDDGATAWLSEDEGQFTFERFKEMEQGADHYATIDPGERVRLGETVFHVDEKDVAVCEGAEGQLPFAVEFGQKTPYVDLSTDDEFATVEWSLDGSYRVFRGRRIGIEELNLETSAREGGGPGDALAVETPGDDQRRQRIVRREDRAKGLSCYHCGASLEVPAEGAESIACSHCGGVVDLSLKPIACANCSAPVAVRGGKEAKTVVCPHCGSQMDLVSRNKPSVIGSLVDARRPKLPLRLGQRGVLRGTAYEVVGHIRYSEREEGVNYVTDELLLHSKTAGYVWLIFYQGHFSLSKELTVRSAQIRPKIAKPKQKFAMAGRRWTVFEQPASGAEVTWVDGELPWVARVGDRIGYMDAVSPPYLLSAEWSESEMEWYLSEYLPREEVARAFGIPEGKLPPAVGVAPNQPYAVSRFRREAPWLMAVFAALNLLVALLLATVSGRPIGRFTVLPAEYASGTLTPPFAVARDGAVCEARFSAPVDNAWLYLDLALVNAKEEALLDFSAEIAYYHGVEDGESWSEGSASDSVPFKVDRAGEYRLLLIGQAGRTESPGDVLTDGRPVEILVFEGVALPRYAIVLALLSAGWAVVELVRWAYFEKRRWAESGDSEDDDEDD